MERYQTTKFKTSLQGISLFAGLESHVLEQIHKNCAWRSYEPGDWIVNYLDNSNDVFFIANGEVRVTIYSVSGKAVSFCDLGTGEVFGEYAAIDGQSRSASVQARSSCEIASLSAASFLKLLGNERVLNELLRKLVKTIRMLDRRVYEFSTLAVNSRIRTHREAVTRELTRLTRLGILERQGHVLVVKDVDRLELIVHDAVGE